MEVSCFSQSSDDRGGFILNYWHKPKIKHQFSVTDIDHWIILDRTLYSCFYQKNIISNGFAGMKEGLVISTLWSVFNRGVAKSGNIIITIMLLKLLSPQDLGVFILSITCFDLLSGLLTPKVGLALIQQEKITPDDYNISWTVDVLFSNIFLAVVFFFGGPFIATLFHSAQLGDILKFVSLFPLIQIFESRGIIHFMRSMRFKEYTILQCSEKFTYLLTAIPLLFFMKNIWGVLVGMLLGKVVRVFASYIHFPHIPRLVLDWQRTKELMFTGRWIWATGAVRSLKGQLSRIVLAGAMSVSDLGIYHAGARFSSQVTAEVYLIFSIVMFPTYSKLQNDRERLWKNYLLILQITVLFVFPFCMAIFCMSEPLVTLFLGPQWESSIIIMKILIIAGFIEIIIETSFPLLRGAGIPLSEFRLNLYTLITLLPMFLVLTYFWGVNGAASAVLLSQLIQLPLAYNLMQKHFPVHLVTILKQLKVPVIIGFATLLGAFLPVFFLKNSSQAVLLTSQLASGALVFLGLIYFSWHQNLIESLSFLKNRTFGK